MPSLEDRLSSVRLVRHLWAVGNQVENAAVGTTIAGRYEVVAPRVWVDRQGDRVPDAPQAIPDEALAYMKQIRQPLHIPQVYGFCDGRANGAGEVMLLENAPIDETGTLYPIIEAAWPEASPVRRVYWLAQLLNIWQQLEPQKLAASLVDVSNIRVQGWRVWLLELKPTIGKPNLTDLAYHWRRWLDLGDGDPTIAPLSELCQDLRSGAVEAREADERLDRILLEAVASQPLQLASFGVSDSGPSRLQNEDCCYPLAEENAGGERRGVEAANLAILCDGVGGHDGGEVASQLAVRTLKLQVETFGNIAKMKKFVAPEAVRQQLATMLRVTNNTIASENDAQNRYDRERMGTTAVVAWQLAQCPAGVAPVAIDGDVDSDDDTRPNAHELFVANVGDSRAYWISAEYCQQLTVDDDLATQEVAAGRCLYREALQYEEAAALTQAIGTRDGTTIEPDVRRFILEEDGVLLLCSDGVSDNNWVEKSWRAFVPPLLAGETTLEASARDWLEVTSEYNGHDNATIALIECRVSETLPPPLEIFEPTIGDRSFAPQIDRSPERSPEHPPERPPLQLERAIENNPFETLTDSSRALLSAPAEGETSEPTRRRRRPKPTRTQQVAAVVSLLVLAVVALWAGLRSNRAPEPPVPEESPAESPERTEPPESTEESPDAEAEESPDEPAEASGDDSTPGAADESTEVPIETTP